MIPQDIIYDVLSYLDSPYYYSIVKLDKDMEETVYKKYYSFLGKYSTEKFNDFMKDIYIFIDYILNNMSWISATYPLVFSPSLSAFQIDYNVFKGVLYNCVVSILPLNIDNDQYKFMGSDYINQLIHTIFPYKYESSLSNIHYSMCDKKFQTQINQLTNKYGNLNQRYFYIIFKKYINEIIGKYFISIIHSEKDSTPEIFEKYIFNLEPHQTMEKISYGIAITQHGPLDLYQNILFKNVSIENKTLSLSLTIRSVSLHDAMLLNIFIQLRKLYYGIVDQIIINEILFDDYYNIFKDVIEDLQHNIESGKWSFIGIFLHNDKIHIKMSENIDKNLSIFIKGLYCPIDIREKYLYGLCYNNNYFAFTVFPPKIVTKRGDILSSKWGNIEDIQNVLCRYFDSVRI